MDRKAIRETIALVSVVAGLGFVGLEIRQNNQLAEAAAYQSLGEATAATWFGAAHDPVMNRRWLESLSADSTWWEAQDPETVEALMSYWVGTMRLYETLYLQVELGLLDPEAMDRLGWGVARDISALKYLWPFVSRGVTPEFQTYVTQNWDEQPRVQVVEDALRRMNIR